MSDEGFHEDEAPGYTFLGTSPAEKFLELAVLHRKEAKQLRESARLSEAEGREEEVRLLIRVAETREQRAQELEKAARGEADDPSVAEVLDGEQEVLSAYVPPTMSFLRPEDLPPATVPMHMRPLPPGNIPRALDWVKRLFKRKRADSTAE
jgi:hypothetical protein